MDPQTKSVLTSVGMALSSAIAGWAVTHGIIQSGDQTSLASALLTVGGVAVAAGIGWYKTHQVSQKAMIQAVNAGDNGVKVVAAAEPAAAVNAPLKEPAK